MYRHTMLSSASDRKLAMVMVEISYDPEEYETQMITYHCQDNQYTSVCLVFIL